MLQSQVLSGRQRHAESHCSFDQIDAHVLTAFPELVTGLGGDPADMLRRVGIEPCQLVQDRTEIGYRQVIELCALAATELSCLDFGMRLARLQIGAIDTPLRDVVRNSATLGEALRHVINLGRAHSPAAGFWLERHPFEESVSIGHDILLDDPPDRRQTIEQFLLVEHLTCIEATGGRARARRVEFRHQPMSSPACYRSHFGCEVLFGQASDALVFSEQALACPIASSDRRACQNTIASIEASFTRHQPPLHLAVRGLVLHLLDSEKCTNRYVASELGLHARTLHRLLTREGTSFQQIKNQVRRDLLVHYLEGTNLSILEISARLGFAEQSATARFCRKALAASPTGRRAIANSQH